MVKPTKGVNHIKRSGEKNQCSQYKWFRHLQEKKAYGYYEIYNCIAV